MVNRKFFINKKVIFGTIKTSIVYHVEIEPISIDDYWKTKEFDDEADAYAWINIILIDNV